MPQDPTGSGSSSSTTSSSSSSSSDLADSDDRNDDDDDDDEEEEEEEGNNDDDDDDDDEEEEDEDEGDVDKNVEHRSNRICDSHRETFDRLARDRRDVNPYEIVTVNDDRRSFECPSSITDRRPLAHDSRPRSRVSDDSRVRYSAANHQDEHHHRFPLRDYTETTGLNESMNNDLHDYTITTSSTTSSANSLDDLCHRRTTIGPTDEAANSRDHYMVPTRADPRELNEQRILSLFNPQFLPNFNDMIMYVANRYDTRRNPPPPPRSRSMAENDGRLFRSSAYRKKRAAASSMFFRRGLTYETARD